VSVESFIPEIWSKKLLTSLKKSLVFAGPDVVNHDYESEISEQGDTVRINSVSRPTIGTYTKGTTSIVPEQLTTAQRSLVVDQAKYFAFEVDNVDRRQAAGDLIAEATVEAAYGLADTADQYVEALIAAAVASANTLGTVSVTTADLAYQKLIALRVVLDTANVPDDGRVRGRPPWYHGLLLDNSKFVADPAEPRRVPGADERPGRSCRRVQHQGVEQLPAGHRRRLPGHRRDARWPPRTPSRSTTKAYEPEDSFSDAVKGLHLYGAKVTRPTAVATMVASIT